MSAPFHMEGEQATDLTHCLPWEIAALCAFGSRGGQFPGGNFYSTPVRHRLFLLQLSGFFFAKHQNYSEWKSGKIFPENWAEEHIIRTYCCFVFRKIRENFRNFLCKIAE